MNAEQLKERLERAARAARDVPVRLSASIDSTDTVRLVAKLWGVDVDVFPSSFPGLQLVTADHRIGRVTIGVQASEPIPPPECDYCGEPCEVGHTRCATCHAAGDCVRCGDPCVEALGYVPREGYCGYCQDDDGDKARLKRRLTQDAEGSR